MGWGYNYICRKCQHEYWVHLGVGMMYPKVYQETLADISEGKYGPELQEIYHNTPYAAVDAEHVVYICDGCGFWESGTDVTLYAPNEPERISQKRYGIKTVAEWGYVPYVTSRELKTEYHIVKRHYHRCGKCGKRMHKATSDELKNLPCPECGAANRAENSLVLWD